MIRSLFRKARAEYYRQTRRKVFSGIYEKHLWEGSESRSGSGSGLGATETVRSLLPSLLKNYAIRSLVDVPCGDFLWMSRLPLEDLLESYRGFDIVPALIAGNREKYARPGVAFDTLDIVRQAPPAADLILCRHLLIHLPFADGLAVLQNFRRSGSRYLLITNQPDHSANTEILWTGSFRPLNLCSPPFDLPEPIARISDASGPGDLTDLSLFTLK